MSSTDPLMVALLHRLPPIGAEWPIDQRLLWLSACEATINLIYGAVDKIEISVPSFLQVPEMSPAEKERLLETLRGGLRQLDGTIKPGDVLTEPDSPVDGATVGEVLTSAGTDTVEPEERAGDEATDEETAIAEPPPKNVGGRPATKSARPADIPQNLAMAIEALTDMGPSTAPDIRAWVRGRYWPDAPDAWTANLWDHALRGRLVLDRDSKVFSLPAPERIAAVERQAEKVAQPKPPAPQVMPREPSKVPMPAVKPTAGPRPKAIMFEHNGESVELASSREYVLAGKLHIAMGKGHISEAFLSQAILGANTENGRNRIKMMALELNGRLASVGLKVEHYPGFGLIMKEVSGG